MKRNRKRKEKNKKKDNKNQRFFVISVSLLSKSSKLSCRIMHAEVVTQKSSKKKKKFFFWVPDKRINEKSN